MNMPQSWMKGWRLVMFLITSIPALTCLTVYFLVVCMVDYLQTKLRHLLEKVQEDRGEGREEHGTEHQAEWWQLLLGGTEEERRRAVTWCAVMPLAESPNR